MALVARNGQPFRAIRALAWALTWGIGAAIGVALGGWLTLVGGAGAPGAEALDPSVDLIVLPLVSLGGVSAIHFLGQYVVAAVRGHRAGERGDEDDEHPQPAGDEIPG